VQRQLRRGVILVLDRWAVHRKAAQALFGDRRFWIEWLPPYAPELNPVEHVWDHTQYGDLANYIPDDVVEWWIWRSKANSRWKTSASTPTCCDPAFMGPSSNHDLLHSRCEDQ